MKSKRIVFRSVNDLYRFNKEATKCKTEVRIKTKSGLYEFDAKTILGLFFVLHLTDVEVLYHEEEIEFDNYLNYMEAA